MRNSAIVLLGLSAVITSACDASQARKDQAVNYQVTGKNGVVYRVNGPAGLKREQVIADVLRQHPEADILAPTFRGDSCTDDCSGHEAGYAWAEEQSAQNYPRTEGRTAQRIGSTTFYSDGTTAQRIGSTTFYSDGTTAQRIGNSTFYSDGTTAQRIGNSTFYSDGTTAQRIGNSTFYSNGTSCQTIGSSEFCN
jgi:hypothetical protein